VRKHDKRWNIYLRSTVYSAPLLFRQIMIKKITHILIVIALLFLSARAVRAEEPVSDASASIKRNYGNAFDYRVGNLRTFLGKYNSPLTEYAEEFVSFADIYGLDYRIVPAITGVESTFGKRIPSNSYNAYGWANGEYRFTSWGNSIEHVSMTLRTKYIDKGAPTIAKIAKRYAPPSVTWGGKVNFFMNKIDTFPISYDI